MAPVEPIAVVRRHPLRLWLIDQRHRLQPSGIEHPGRGMLTDVLVHQRLGCRRLIRLIVAMAPIADQVDHHVPMEPHSVLERQPGHEHHRLRIIGIHVEDRRLHHLRHIRAILGGTGIARVAGREADLVVDDDVDRAPDPEPPGLGHIEHLHHHALTGKGGIAMDHDRQYPIAGPIPAPILTGTHRAHHHRVDDFQMRGIEGQREVDTPVFDLQIGGKAQMVFYVARAATAPLVLALELLEELLGRLAEDIDQHVQTTSVGHAYDDFLDVPRRRLANQIVELGNQGIRPLQRKTLLADVAGMQILLDTFGCGELHQDVAPLSVREHPLAVAPLQALLYPALLPGIGDMHVFRTYGVGIHPADDLVDPPQRQTIIGI